MKLTIAALALIAPQDQPTEPPSGLVTNAEGAFQGYTLFAPLRSGTTFLIDMQGRVVHEWKHGFASSANYLLDDGHLVFLSRIDDNPTFFGGGIGGRVRELDWDGNLVWEWILSTETRITHHDLEPLPSGNFLAIAWEHLLPDEAIARGRDPKAVSDKGWWPDVVLEVQPTRPSGAKVVWEWRMRDHLIQDFDPTKANYGSPADRPERFDVNFDHRNAAPLSAEELEKQRELEKQLRELGYAGGADDTAASDDGDAKARARRDGDWAHTNSVHYDPANDLILLSSPEMCEIWMIDHSTTTEEARGSTGGRYGKGGDVLWRWGNPANYGCGTAADKQLFYQHQPEWIPRGHPGEGHVIVFNNGSGRPGEEHSSVDELALDFDSKLGFARAKGEAFAPSSPTWSYSAPKKSDFYSFFISGSQRLRNGNTFICSGQQGRFFEVTPDHRIVWEFWNPWGGELEASNGGADPRAKDPERKSPVRPTSVFRATRISPMHPGLRGRELKPIER